VTAPAVEARHVSVDVDGAVLLDRISLEVERGGWLAVIGPNGAGKTTLLRCLDGLVAPTSGEIRLAGRDLRSYSRRQLAREVSYVPQSPPRSDDYTVRQYVELGRFPHLGAWGMVDATDRRAVDEALDVTEIGHLASRTVASLSGGEFQRTLIAAALAQGGRLLLLDEPTSFLDFRHQVQVLGLLSRLHRDTGMTIVAVTHDLNGAARATERIVALKDGRIVDAGTPGELLRPDRLRPIFDTGFRTIGAGAPLVLPVRDGG
jgi:iron complex transport system ATP-binding protein